MRAAATDESLESPCTGRRRPWHGRWCSLPQRRPCSGWLSSSGLNEIRSVGRHAAGEVEEGDYRTCAAAGTEAAQHQLGAQQGNDRGGHDRDERVAAPVR